MLFVPKKDELRGTSCCVLLTTYYLGDQIERIEMTEYVAGMGDRRGTYRFWRTWERDKLEDLGVDGRTILNWIFK